jgi:hypothetical protein
MLYPLVLPRRWLRVSVLNVVPRWGSTTPEERLTVVEFLVEQATKYKASLSPHSLRDTLKYFVGQKEHGYSTDWRHVVVKELNT